MIIGDAEALGILFSKTRLTGNVKEFLAVDEPIHPPRVTKVQFTAAKTMNWT